MNRNEHDPDFNLDRIVSDIREDEASPEVVSGAADRVWARLGGASADESASGASSGAGASSMTIRGCAGFTALLPAYVAKTLPAARALLVEDHVHDCAACRGALETVRGGRPSAKVVPFGTPAGAARSTERVPRRSFASRVTLAAAAAAVLGLAGLGAWLQYGRGPADTARVASVHGTLYRVADGAAVPIAEGASFHYGEDVRTAKDSGAVIRLADGSLVEMGERAELSLSGRSDTTINLPRGNIIVQATKRASGHLFVRSGDALVSVTGTIFAVSHGTMGTRVSVIEGEVHVERIGAKDVLHPGQQVTTQASLARVPVEQDIAWSKDIDRYATLLRELKSLRADLATTSLTGELRHSTKLLDAQPEGTMLYAAIPNMSGNLAEANRKIQDHIAQSSVLRQWWEAHHGAEERVELEKILDKIHAFGSHLGDEVTVSLQMGADGEPSGVLLMSEVKDPEAFGVFLAGEVAKVNAEATRGGSLRILPADLAQAGPDGAARSFTHDGPSEFVLWIHGDRFVASSSVGLVREAAASLDHPEAGGFASSSFRQRIADSYRDGAGWLFAVDMEKVLERASRDTAAGADGTSKSAALQQTGILDAKQFILEVKETGERTTTRGVLSFGQERRGIASWLAAPAPMGALQFMSPEATMMAAFVVKEPVLLVDDLFEILGAADASPVQGAARGDFGGNVAKFESESGLSIRDDIAAPLGGEFAFAVDGPVLPTPSWKVVVEVYDPPRLQHTFETIVAKLAEKARQSGSVIPVPALESEVAGGRTFYTVRASGEGTEVHYVFVDGYMVAGPSRALLERAIQNREAGFVLTSSQTFRDLLPQDGHVNFSALVYQNVGPLLKPIAQQMSGAFTPEQRAAVASLGSETAPSLAYAYGEQDRIIVATSGTGSLASQLGGGILGVHGGDQGIAKLFSHVLTESEAAAVRKAAANKAAAGKAEHQ